MNNKQRRFCEEYLVDLNATQAAIRAGYSARSARNQAHRMMTNDDILAYIQHLQNERSKRTQIEADRVLEELARLAFYDPTEVIEWGPEGFKIKGADELSEDARRIVASVSESPSQWGWRRQVRFHDKLKALELVGRHLGMFVDRHEHSGPRGEPIKTIEIVRSTPPADSRREELLRQYGGFESQATPHQNGHAD